MKILFVSNIDRPQLRKASGDCKQSDYNPNANLQQSQTK